MHARQSVEQSAPVRQNRDEQLRYGSEADELPVPAPAGQRLVPPVPNVPPPGPTPVAAGWPGLLPDEVPAPDVPVPLDVPLDPLRRRHSSSVIVPVFAPLVPEDPVSIEVPVPPLLPLEVSPVPLVPGVTVIPVAPVVPDVPEASVAPLALFPLVPDDPLLP